jgi:hypothetical protein
MTNDRILDREENRERIARHLLATMHAMGVNQPHVMIDFATRMQWRILTLRPPTC